MLGSANVCFYFTNLEDLNMKLYEFNYYLILDITNE